MLAHSEVVGIYSLNEWINIFTWRLHKGLVHSYVANFQLSLEPYQRQNLKARFNISKLIHNWFSFHQRSPFPGPAIPTISTMLFPQPVFSRDVGFHDSLTCLPLFQKTRSLEKALQNYSSLPHTSEEKWIKSSLVHTHLHLLVSNDELITGSFSLKRHKSWFPRKHLEDLQASVRRLHWVDWGGGGTTTWVVLTYLKLEIAIQMIRKRAKWF